MADCGTFDLVCKVGDAAAGFVENALGSFANAAVEAAGRAVASAGTIWVNIPTPDLADGTGTTTVTAGSHAENSDAILTLLGYLKWIGLALALGSLMVAWGVAAARRSHGQPAFAGSRVMLILAVTTIIGAAGPIAAAITPKPGAASSAVLFLQNSLFWYTVAAAGAGIVVAAMRVLWTHRLDPARDMAQGLVNLIVWGGAGVTIISLLTKASDSFATWLLDNSLDCSASTDGSCFGSNMLNVLALTSGQGPAMPAIILLVLGIVALIASAVQIILMVIRAGMLVLLSGALATVASLSGTAGGRQTLNKYLGWVAAWVLYKPVAAAIYAVGFQMSGANVFTDDGSGFVTAMAGFAMLGMALVALPALMKWIAPAVGAMAGSVGGGGGGAAMAAVAAGAPLGSYLGRGSGAGSGSGAGAPPVAGGTQSTGMPAAGPSAATTGGAASTGGAAATAGSATTAGAAAGPAGMAAGAAADTAVKAGKAVKGAAQGATEASTAPSATAAGTGAPPAPAPSGGSAAGSSGGAGAAMGAAQVAMQAGSAVAGGARSAVSSSTDEKE